MSQGNDVTTTIVFSTVIPAVTVAQELIRFMLTPMGEYYVKGRNDVDEYVIYQTKELEKLKSAYQREQDDNAIEVCIKNIETTLDKIDKNINSGCGFCTTVPIRFSAGAQSASNNLQRRQAKMQTYVVLIAWLLSFIAGVIVTETAVPGIKSSQRTAAALSILIQTGLNTVATLKVIRADMRTEAQKKDKVVSEASSALDNLPIPPTSA